jgi:hypothetical protein
MNCPNCGSDVKGAFCTNCGTKVSQEAGAPAAPRDPESTSVLRGEDMAAFSQQQGAEATNPPSWSSEGPPTASTRSTGEPPDNAPPPADDGGWKSTPPSQQQPAYPPPAATAPAPQPATPRMRPAMATGGRSNWSAPLDNFAQSSGIQKALAPLEQLGRQKIVWIAAAVLIIGLFLPERTYTFSSAFISASASQSWWDYSTLGALLVLILAAASAFVAYARDYKWLWISGIIVLVFEVKVFIDAFSSIVVGASFHPSWGWIFLFIGMLGLLAAAMMRPSAGEAQGDAMATINQLMNRQ